MESLGRAPYVLDDLDRRILDQMQRDSSLTNQELAARVHASPPTSPAPRAAPVGSRRDRAPGGHTLVPKSSGSSLTAIVEITLDVQAAEQLEEFERAVAAEDAVLQC